MSDFYFANVSLEPNPVNTSSEYEIKVGIQEGFLALEDGKSDLIISSNGKGIWAGEVVPVIEDGNGNIMIGASGEAIWAGIFATVLEDGEGNLIEDGYGNLIRIPATYAFAIYSADDYSLTFYSDTWIPEAGSQYNGKTATNVYQDVDTIRIAYPSDVPWYNVRSRIVSVSFDRSFESVRPSSFYCWFSEFENCEKIDLQYLDTSNVTDMSDMFKDCSKITDLDLSRFDTSNVLYMTSMFYGCAGITVLDISDLYTPNLTEMTSMFYGMSNLKTVYSDDDHFTVENLDSRAGYYVFEGCDSIVGGAGTKYDDERTNYTMAHVDTLTNPGYFTQK